MAEQINVQLLIDTAAGAKNLGQLKTSLKDLRKAFDSAEIGSEQFLALADAIDETVERTRSFKNGIDNIKQFEAAGSVLTNTFALATSTIAVFAGENEELQKSLLKVQGALGIAQSFSGLADAIGKANSAGLALNATLLANPYVLVGAAVIGLALALSSLDDAQEKAAKSAKELADAQFEVRDGTLAVVDDAISKYDEEVNKLSLTITDETELAKAVLKVRKDEYEQLILNKGITDKTIASKRKEITDLTEAIKVFKQNKISIIQTKDSYKDYNKRLEENQEKLDGATAQLKSAQASYKQITEVTNKYQKAIFDLDKVLKKRAEDDKKANEERLKQLDALDEALINQLLKENEIDDAKQKRKELKNIENLNKAYNDLVNTQEFELQLLKAKGTSETTINLQRKLQIQDLIKANESAIITIEESGLSYSETATESEKYKDEIIKLKRELELLEVQLGKTTNKTINNAEEFKKGVKQIGNDIQLIGQSVLQGVNVLTQAFEQSSQIRLQILENEKNESIKILDEQLNTQIISQAEYDAKRLVLDEEYNKKIKAEKGKAFAAQKAADIIQATLNTALAVTRTLSELGATPLGIGLAATAGALGAAQVALIASQPVPEFATGGMVNGAGTSTSDSINARLSNGESVINARSTAMFAPLLSAINQMGGGISFNEGTKLTKLPQGNYINKTEKTSQNLNIDVRISEKEITTVQNKIKKINQRTTF